MQFLDSELLKRTESRAPITYCARLSFAKYGQSHFYNDLNTW
jgi:hypothetical protein